MGRFYTIIGAAVIAGVASLAAGSTASAASYCPASESFFGVIQRVDGNMLTVSTDQGHWADVRVDRGARINANGLALRPGTFVGAYGCLTPNGVFNASEVTLSASRGSYNESLSGIVERVASDRLTVRQFGHGYGTWFVPDADRFRVGQQVSAVGMIGANGVFYPQRIDGQSIAFEPVAVNQPRTSAGTITLSGVVVQVRARSLIVREPSRGTTGTWIVRDADRFRVGERLVARGTEDTTGRFYPIDITIH